MALLLLLLLLQATPSVLSGRCIRDGFHMLWAASCQTYGCHAAG
jgi:hypothetical protein